jgi:hypothetical protein
MRLWFCKPSKIEPWFIIIIKTNTKGTTSNILQEFITKLNHACKSLNFLIYYLNYVLSLKLYTKFWFTLISLVVFYNVIQY